MLSVTRASSRRAPVGRLAPRTRLLAAGGVGAVCLLAPFTPGGAAVVAVVVASWLWACRPSMGSWARGTMLGAACFLPYLLAVCLAPEDRDAVRRSSSALAAAAMTFRGLGVVWTSLGAVSTIDEHDLVSALKGLGTPWFLVALVEQILHQSGWLLRESRQIAVAMALRGGTGSGRLPWLVLASVPAVWLPRVAARAERLAIAMEVRGYPESVAVRTETAAMKPRDVVAVTLTLAAVAAAAALRWGGRP